MPTSDRMDSLCGILKKMIEDSSGQNTFDVPYKSVQKFYEDLKKVYSEENFRHSYAILSQFLSRYTPDAYPVLKQWLVWVIDFCNAHHEEGTQGLYQKLQKLLDHIELECIRLDRMQSLEHLHQEMLDVQTNIQKNVEDIQKSKDEIQKLNQETRKMSESVNKRIDDYHGQSIAILGIFSAVVLVFMSGIGFSSSVLDNINKASLFRLGFTILLLGIVLSNVIYILLRYILYLSKRNSGEDPPKYKTGQVWLNIVLGGLFCLLLLAYGLGIDRKIAYYRQDSDNFDTIPYNSSLTGNT